ncbi:MAG: hypothetical protein EXR71_19225 [Myxococcales bacterium]|nr:hypothetical protein [Myxococcales bacterium]
MRLPPSGPRDAMALGGNVVIGLLILAVTSWLVLHRRPRVAVFVVLSIGVGLGLLAALKLGLDRPRPPSFPTSRRCTRRASPTATRWAQR